MQPFHPFREPWTRIIGIPVVGLVLLWLTLPGPKNVFDAAISIGVTAVMWQGSYTLIQIYRKRFPGTDLTVKRLLLTVLSIVLFIVAVDFLICVVLDLLGIQPNSYFNGQWVIHLKKALGATIVIGTLYETGYYFAMWKEQTVEMEALRSKQLRTELETLRNQVSPHFLFNSLNTLVTLINEDPVLAERFTKDLSHVYRYILQHKEKEVVDLGSELDFTEAYIQLMKVRFEDSLRITVQVPPEHRHLQVAPLALQLLLENALKHNVASVAQPLHVDITVENGRTLIVRNSLRRKTGRVEGTGTGLANVKQRYEYLSDRPVDVIETREHFLVALPLLEFSENKDLVS